MKICSDDYVCLKMNNELNLEESAVLGELKNCNLQITRYTSSEILYIAKIDMCNQSVMFGLERKFLESGVIHLQLQRATTQEAKPWDKLTLLI